MLSLVYIYKYGKEYQTAEVKSLSGVPCFVGELQLGVGLMLMPKACDSRVDLKCFPKSCVTPPCVNISFNWGASGIT